MKTIRNNLLIHCVAARTFVFVLAIYTVLPAQLVWCSRQGQDPVIEPAFAGQCVSITSSSCCYNNPATTSARLDLAGLQPVTVSENEQYHPCLGCSDEVIHRQTESCISANSGVPRIFDPGGILFFAGGIGLSKVCSGSISTPQDEFRIPELSTQYVSITQLLI